MNNNETLADIVREMRTYFQAKKRGNPEHRPWHQVLSDWADRIEAAYARDIGNVAAMRETLEALVTYLDKEVSRTKKCGRCKCNGKTFRGEPCYWHSNCGISEFDVEASDRAKELLRKFKLRAALSAPPRNCDRFGTLEEATDAWRTENRTWQWADDNTAANYMKDRASQDVGEFLDWLFAPAEGGAE